jgi:hypothetical protein
MDGVLAKVYAAHPIRVIVYHQLILPPQHHRRGIVAVQIDSPYQSAVKDNQLAKIVKIIFLVYMILLFAETYVYSQAKVIVVVQSVQTFSILAAMLEKCVVLERVYNLIQLVVSHTTYV